MRKREVFWWLGRLDSVAKVLRILSILSACVLVSGCAAVFVGAAAAMSSEENRTKVAGFLEELSDSIERSTKRTNTAQSTAQEIGHRSGDGLVLRLYSSSIEPRVANPGDEVIVTIEYGLAGAPANGVDVDESRVLHFNGSRLASLNSDEERRENGTWESALSFRVPSVAEEGSYEVIQELDSGKQKVTSSVYFEVRS